MAFDEYAKQYLNQKYDIHKLALDTKQEKAVTGEEFVINYLAFHPLPVFPKELRENMNTSTARVAAILRHLAKEKLIEIHADSADGRRHSVNLNEAGMKVACAIRDARMRRMTEIFERLGERDTEEYIRITQKMIEICTELGGDF